MEFIATRQKKEFIDFPSQNGDASIYGYGAAAKGNTFLNYCEVSSSNMKGVFDAAKSKQGKFLPGSRLPVLSPHLISELKPDFLVIFPWNISDEVIRETEYISDWGGKHVLAMPTFRILE